MHYIPRLKNHQLPHDPLLALVVPRPIGWITTLARDGTINLAPYSFFNVLSGRPYYVMFASTGRKDSQRNAEETGEFVCNMASYALRDAVDKSSARFEADVSESDVLGLEMAPSRVVKPPRVARSPAALECSYWKTVDLPGIDGNANASIVIGEVVGVYIDDGVLVDGMVDLRRAQPVSRLGYLDYGLIGEIWSAPRPDAQQLLADTARESPPPQ